MSPKIERFEVPMNWKKNRVNVHELFQAFLTRESYWNANFYLLSPLKADAPADFSELERLLEERPESIPAFEPLDGNCRDWYCNADFVNGSAVVVVYARNKMEPVKGRFNIYRITVEDKKDAAVAVIMPSTAFVPASI